MPPSALHPPAPLASAADASPPDDWHRLVYTSAAVAPLSPDHLAELLRAGRQRNRDAGITGLMGHHGGCFLHFLEGPTTAVATVFGSLLRDRRHRDVRLMANEAMGARAFADWYMGYAEFDTPAWRSLAGAGWARDVGQADGVPQLQALWRDLRTRRAPGADPGPPGFWGHAHPAPAA